MGRRLALLGPLFVLVPLIVMGCGGQLAPSYLMGEMKIGFALLHPLTLIYALSGSAMISATLRIPKP